MTPAVPVPTLGTVLAESAARHPDREAYVDAGARLTYGALDRAADGVAAGLASLGVTPGSVVALAMRSSADFAVAYLGAVRAGAVTSAVNLRLGPAERAHVTARTTPAVTIAEDDDPVPDGSGTVVRRRDLAGLAAAGGPPPRPRIDPEDPVAIVWTSGTTGRPKGTVYDHVALAEISRGMGALTAPGDRRLLVVPFPHVGYMTRVWDDLHHGVTVVLPGEPWSAARTVALLRDEAITVATGVPTQWHLVLEEPGLDGVAPLRVAAVGGATVPAELVRRIRERLGCPVLVRYTSTEAGITTGTAPDDPDEVVATTVGRPSPVVEVRLAGDDGPVDAGTPGAVGEVRVRSRAMFRGYWRDAEATAAALDEDGWLRTGDLGAWTPEGNLRLVGRLVEMYVRGGFNVYPAEVEGVLGAHPAVGRVAVVGYPDPVLGERGCAFVVPAPGAEAPTLAALRDWCRAHLADYKAPDRLVVVDDLPVTAMAKVDTRRLARRAAGDGGGDEGDVEGERAGAR